MKTITNEKIAEIKRLVSGGTTSKDVIARMYGLTESQLEQVINHV